MIICTRVQHVSKCNTLYLEAAIKITVQLTMVLNLLQYYQYKKHYASPTEEKRVIFNGH
jgi:hypothetical protein